MGRLPVLVVALLSTFAFADDNTPQLPRPAPDLAIPLPQGGQTSLSQYRGKVVLLEFLLTTCPHCQHASELTSKLMAEYGPRGFQALGCAFDPMAKMVVPDFVRDHQVNYPVGFCSREVVYQYLGANLDYGIHVPQLVFIDRAGVIRHQSLFRGDGETAREENVRSRIEALLKEPAPAARRASSRSRARP